MIDHVTLQVGDVPAAVSFYQAVLAPLEIRPGPTDGDAVGFFGPEPGSFWLCPAQRDGDRELHLAFRARHRGEVDGFHAAAVAIGAEILHAPRLFPEYHEHYYAAFIRDLDGHNIEAVCGQPEP
jgi:catechol 2,3-dioxygenase-like lactoylglutathione lyase family enzyme